MIPPRTTISFCSGPWEFSWLPWGVLSIALMKDAPTLKPNRQGTFSQQFLSVFQFRKLKENPNIKELLLALSGGLLLFHPLQFLFCTYGELADL